MLNSYNQKGSAYRQAGITQIVILLIVVIGVVLGVILSQNPQIFRPKAATAPIDGGTSDSVSESRPPAGYADLNMACNEGGQDKIYCLRTAYDPGYTNVECKRHGAMGDFAGNICMFGPAAYIQSRGARCLQDFDCVSGTSCRTENGTVTITNYPPPNTPISRADWAYCVASQSVSSFSVTNNQGANNYTWDQYLERRTKIINPVRAMLVLIKNSFKQSVTGTYDWATGLSSAEACTNVCGDSKKENCVRNMTQGYTELQDILTRNNITVDIDNTSVNIPNQNYGNLMQTLVQKGHSISEAAKRMNNNTSCKTNNQPLPELNNLVTEFDKKLAEFEKSKEELKTYLNDRRCVTDAECSNQTDNRQQRVSGRSETYLCAPDTDVDNYAKLLKIDTLTRSVYHGCNMPNGNVPPN